MEAALALWALWPSRVRNDGIAQAIALSRADARHSGAEIAQRQLRRDRALALTPPTVDDHAHGHITALFHERADTDAKDWVLERSVVTETAVAFNEGIVEEGKAIADEYDIELEKVWSAENDARTCAVCAALDGTVVDLNEEFEGGGPGEVHPNCRCTVSLRRKTS